MNKMLLTCTILFLFANTLKSQVRITMQKEGGVYTTPCTVNGLRLRFIFDTGASNVSLSLSEAIFMIKNGYLDKEDLHGSSYSQIANGDIVENTTVNLKELEIGGIKIYNVEATIIHELSAPLLLGQSAIQKLGKIQLENNELIIMSLESPYSDKACKEAEELVKQAQKYYFDRLYTLSSDTYQKAFDLCPDAIDCFGIYLFGNSYFLSDNYLLAIKYLEKSVKCETDIETLMYAYGNLGDSYFELGKYDISTLNTQKALTYATKDEDISHFNFRLGYLKSHQKQFSESNDYYTKSVDSYLKYLNTSTNEVMKGKVKDEALGERYWNIAMNYFEQNQQTKFEGYVIKAALCGYEIAIEGCKQTGLNYQLFLE